MNCAIHNETPATAYCRTCGKAMCAQCTREVKGVIYCEDCIANSLRQGAPAAVPPPPPAYAHYAAQTRSDVPNPTLAGILSFFVPGLGCVYAGEVLRGAMNLIVFAALIAIENALGDSEGLQVFVGLSIAFWYVYQIIDAVRVAKAKATGTVPDDPFGLYAGVKGRAFRRGERVMPMGPLFLVLIGFIFLLSNVFSLHMVGKLWPLILVYFGAVRLYDTQQNLPCTCARCRTRYLTGPVVLLTLGIILLLNYFTPIGFQWPILLIAIGAVKFLQIAGPTEGHVGPGEPGTNNAPPPAADEAKESQVNHG